MRAGSIALKGAKRALRVAIRKKRAALVPQEKRLWDRALTARVLAWEEYRNAQRIFCYVSTKEEPDTKGILEDALKSGKTVAVPRVMPKNEKGAAGESESYVPTMKAIRIAGMEDLSETGSFGIPEPAEGLQEEVTEFDLILAPCLACDEKRRRLGHGGGYYDVFLEKQKDGPGPGPTVAVLCYEGFILEKVPTEPNDIPGDAVITEERIL